MVCTCSSQQSGGPCIGVRGESRNINGIKTDISGDATACPYNHFESCVEGNMSKQETIVRTIAQVIGGVAVFRLIQVLWGIEIAETHVGRSHSAIYSVCSADLTVPVLHGAIIEGVATWVCRIGSRSAKDLEFWS